MLLSSNLVFALCLKIGPSRESRQFTGYHTLVYIISQFSNKMSACGSATYKPHSGVKFKKMSTHVRIYLHIIMKNSTNQ
jgi:hypothetical protein